jgi:hypothetical protein
MKLLSLALSLLRAKKRNFILMMICIIFSTLLFNFAITASSDYLTEKAYMTSHRYDKKILHGTLSSKSPITDVKIASQFEKYGINCRVERYHETILELFSVNSRITDNEINNMDDDAFYRFYNDINGTLLGYSTEYSEYLDIGLSGERPDKSKDYGGKIPVIANYTSRYNIGDTIKYKCGKGITELIVVGKYTDNYLDSVILYNADTESLGTTFYTDADILYNSGLATAPENQKDYSGESEDKRYYQYVIILKNNNSSLAETEARIIDGLNANSDDAKGDLYMNIRYPADPDLLYRDNMLLIQLMPVFIMIAIVGTLGVIANILLNAEKRTKAMAVFRLCGGKIRSVIILELVCDTAVTVISVLAATLILLAINSIFAIEIINAQSGLFTAVYLIAISVIVSIAGSVTLVRSNMLETIRRYENV